MKMKAMIKKFFLISILLLSTNFCFAAETIEIFMGSDYLVTSDEKVKTVLVANPAIISLTPYFTIFNEKNILSLHPKRIGKSTVTFCLEGSEVVFSVVVKSDKNKKEIEALKLDGFEILSLDTPPKMKQLPKLKDLKGIDTPVLKDREGD